MGFLEWTYNLLVIFGALAFFLFGMKLMSESLQKLAGEKMRQRLSAITSSPWKGMATGLGITAMLQSSSASTVMIVGFVNAGLVSVLESVGLIIGANIGTTITAWLITFFGYSFNIKLFLLPILAISIPLYLARSRNRQPITEFIMGFAILFFGLQFMREALPSIQSDSQIIAYLSEKAQHGPASYLLIALLGFVITLIIQSSTAAITLTMVLYSDGFIGFEVAAIMIIGHNIGTSITANIAALVGNRSAKRSALIHLLFNLLGAILFIPFFTPMVRGISHFAEMLSALHLIGDTTVSPLKISLFHTGFNLAIALVFIWFVKYLVDLSRFIIPLKDAEEEDIKLEFHDSYLVSTSELSIAHVSKELDLMALRVRRMFKAIPDLLIEKDPESFNIIYHNLKRREQETDKLESDIMAYLTRISESKLSNDGSRLLHTMLTITGKLERISDECFKMARVIENKNKQKAWFTQEQRNALFGLFTLVEEALSLMAHNLNKPDKAELEKAEALEAEINEKRRSMVEQHLADLHAGKYHISAGNLYQQLIVSSEKIGDHAVDVSAALLKHARTTIPKL